jgi:hypothetical protein
MRNPDAFVILVLEGNMSTWSELSKELSSTVQDVGKSVIGLQAEGNRAVSGIVLVKLLLWARFSRYVSAHLNGYLVKM